MMMVAIWYELSMETSPRVVQSDWITAMARLDVVSPGQNSNFNLPRVTVVVVVITWKGNCHVKLWSHITSQGIGLAVAVLIIRCLLANGHITTFLDSKVVM